MVHGWMDGRTDRVILIYRPNFVCGRYESLKFVEDHPMNIHVQFGFNHICSF